MYELVREYIDSLPEDQRADEPLYQSRLAQCKDCTELRNGTCVLCGCYVEMRAAKKRMNCPMVPARWKAEQL